MTLSFHLRFVLFVHSCHHDEVEICWLTPAENLFFQLWLLLTQPHCLCFSKSQSLSMGLHWALVSVQTTGYSYYKVIFCKTQQLRSPFFKEAEISIFLLWYVNQPLALSSNISIYIFIFIYIYMIAFDCRLFMQTFGQ